VAPAADADAAAMTAAAAADAVGVTKLPHKSIGINARADSLLSFGPCSLSGFFVRKALEYYRILAVEISGGLVTSKA
jgi:hypothetical protein